MGNTGSTGTFSGSTSFTGGGYSGGGFSGNSFRGGTTSVGPTASNPFGSFYTNPLAMGLSTGTNTGISTATFGQPLYASLFNTTGVTTGLTGGFGAAGGLSSSSTSTGFNTVGMRRTSPYVTDVGSPTLPNGGNPNGGKVSLIPSRVLTEVRGVLDRSSKLTTGKNIVIGVSGDTIVLQGYVPTPDERRMAEGLIRMTPGVRAVRNELKVGQPPKTAGGR
jgi:hypothetical protein